MESGPVLLQQGSDAIHNIRVHMMDPQWLTLICDLPGSSGSEQTKVLTRKNVEGQIVFDRARCGAALSEMNAFFEAYQRKRLTLRSKGSQEPSVLVRSRQSFQPQK